MRESDCIKVWKQPGRGNREIFATKKKCILKMRNKLKDPNIAPKGY